MSIIAETVVIGKRSKNSSSITATTVTVAAGGTNTATGEITAQNVTVASGGKNIGEITVTGTVTVAGTNSGDVIGSVILDGGTNTDAVTITGNLTINSGNSAAAVTGNVTMSGGSNAGPVAGNVTMSGGSNAGPVAGDLYVLNQAAINVASVAGSIIASSGINLSPTVPAGYSGSVIQVSGNTLTTTPYTAGSASGPPVTASDGTYYNLQGDSKAYTYANGTGEVFSGTRYNLQGDSKAYTYAAGVGSLFSGNAYNLTGDSKAYSWASGVKGALFTGNIGSSSYVNGVLQAPTSASFTVTGDTSPLYTASGGSVTSGPVFSDDTLDALFTGVFTYSGTTYYAESGTPNTYRAWTVTNDSNSNVLYTIPAGDVTASVPYTNTGLTTGYTGLFTYNSTSYYAFQGTPNTYRAWTVSNDSNSNVLYTIPAGDILTNTIYSLSTTLSGYEYTGPFTYESTDYYSDSGTLQTYRAWTVTEDSNNGVLYTQPLDSVTANASYTSTGLTTPYAGGFRYDNLLYRTDASAGATGLFNGAYYDAVTSSYYSVSSGLVSGAPASGIARRFSDNSYYRFDAGASYAFNGAYNNSVTYVNVDSGVVTGDNASGARQLADNGLVYAFSGDGAAGTLFTGVIQDLNGSYYNVAAGAITANYASGISNLGNSSTYFFVFDGVGGGTAFNGAYLTTNNYYNIDNGYLTGAYASGIRQLGNDSLYYNFPGNGNSGALFTGAFYNGTSYYSVVAGEVTANYAGDVLRLVNDGKFYVFDNSGSAGVLFTGSFQEGPGYEYSVDAGVLSGGYSSGIRQRTSDSLVYNYTGNGSLGSLFTGIAIVRDNRYYNIAQGVLVSLLEGATLSGGSYYSVAAGVQTNNNATGVLVLIGDSLYYNFPGDGTIGTPFTGAVKIGTSYYSVLAGVREATATFTGAYNDGGVYRRITTGATDGSTASGVLMLDSNGLVYTFDGAGNPGTLFTGVANVVNNKFYNIAAGVLGTLFDGAVYVGVLYFGVTAGVQTNNHASGVLKLASDGLYYIFDGNGTNAGTLFNGILEINPVTNTSYNTYKDGALYMTATAISYYSKTCDSPTDRVWLVLEGTNIHDKVIQAGTGVLIDGIVNYTVAGAKSGSFTNTGSIYTYVNGAISNIVNCDQYAAD